jgi:hypothetical protein
MCAIKSKNRLRMVATQKRAIFSSRKEKKPLCVVENTKAEKEKSKMLRKHFFFFTFYFSFLLT